VLVKGSGAWAWIAWYAPWPNGRGRQKLLLLTDILSQYHTGFMSYSI